MNADSDQELLMVLDEEGNSTGELRTREYVHKNRLFHNEVSIFILNGNDILLERRNKNKRLYPGKLCVPGGHVLGNQKILECVIKEVKEEIGLDLEPDNVYFIMRFKKITGKQNCYQSAFYAFTNKPIGFFKKQDSEVDELLYMNFYTFLNLTKKEDSEVMYNYYEEEDLFNILEKIVKEGE